MRAARFHDWATPPVVEEVPEPVRGEGEVFVEVEAAAVAHLDVTIASGTFGMKPPLPYIGGVEGAGVVLEADDLPAGTQVMLRGAGLGMLRDGTWCERISLPRKAVTPLQPVLPAEVAATFFVPSTTAHVAVHDVGGVTADDHVIVTGATGAVGSMAAQLALLAGARVTGVVSSPDRIGRLPSGVDGVALTDGEAVVALDKARSGSVLIDTVGGSELPARARWVSPGGKAVLIGYTRGTEVSFDLSAWLLDDVALLPVNMIRRERQARAVAGELLRLLAEGRVLVETQGFAEPGLALEALRGGGVEGRAVWWPGGV